MSRCKVLIVEDEKILSDVYSIVLRKNDFEVEVAVNGLQALKKLTSYHPDMILLDLLMPKMDGITFLKTVKPSTIENVSIVVYSNLLDSDTDTTVRELGACEVVLKSSTTPDQLVELLSRLCGQYAGSGLQS